jgi:hypothetical protein
LLTAARSHKPFDNAVARHAIRPDDGRTFSRSRDPQRRLTAAGFWSDRHDPEGVNRLPERTMLEMIRGMIAG